LSRQALCPRADASQLLPIPVGPHRIKFSWASIQPHAASFWNSARSGARRDSLKMNSVQVSEKAALRGLSQLREPSKIPAGIDLGIGVPPCSDVMPRRPQKHSELHLLGVHVNHRKSAGLAHRRQLIICRYSPSGRDNQKVSLVVARTMRQRKQDVDRTRNGRRPPAPREV
jgi:hypothetical protein